MRSKKVSDVTGRTSSTINVTHEKLADLPFDSAKALKAAQEHVQLQVWKRMEEARVIHEMLQRAEFSFWHDEFKQGLICAYGEADDRNLVRVHSEGNGIRIDINKSLADAAPASDAVLGALVKSMSESFASTYYRAKGILPSSENLIEDVKLNKIIKS